jgi:hypothetical protein
MKVKFPSEDANMMHKQLAYDHLCLLKQQLKCELFYWRSAGVFILLSMVFFILHVRSFVSSPFIWIVFTGIGTFLVLARNMTKDFECGIQVANCVEKGANIEKKFAYLGGIFKLYEANKLLSYRADLLSRLFPLGFTAFATSIASVILALKAGIWVAVIVGIFSIGIIFIGSRFFIAMSRKHLLCEQ